MKHEWVEKPDKYNYLSTGSTRRCTVCGVDQRLVAKHTTENFKHGCSWRPLAPILCTGRPEPALSAERVSRALDVGGAA